MNFVVGGTSNQTGFIIQVYSVFSNNFFVLKTSNYKEESKIVYNRKLYYILRFLLYFIGVATFFYFSLDGDYLKQPTILNFLLRIIGVVFFVFGWLRFVSYFLTPFFIDSQTKRWHATEHKTIKFISKNFKYPTRESLELMPTFSWGCTILRLARKALVGIHFIVISLFILRMINFNWLDLIFFVNFYSVFCVIFLVFYEYLTLKKPDDEMLDEGVRVIKDYYENKFEPYEKKD